MSDEVFFWIDQEMFNGEKFVRVRRMTRAEVHEALEDESPEDFVTEVFFRQTINDRVPTARLIDGMLLLRGAEVVLPVPPSDRWSLP